MCLTGYGASLKNRVFLKHYFDAASTVNCKKLTCSTTKVKVYLNKSEPRVVTCRFKLCNKLIAVKNKQFKLA